MNRFIWSVVLGCAFAGICVGQDSKTPGVAPKTDGPVELLSDSQGVDFRPYLNKVLPTVQSHWFNLIPDQAKPPFSRSGEVSIQFAVMPDGKITELVIAKPSGSVDLDRAAYAAIKASAPFPRLPSEFKGPSMALRFHFIYNPKKKHTAHNSRH